MPECSPCDRRSKSVRLAMPSSSANSDAGEPEPVLDVDGALRVVAQLLLRVLEEAHVLGVEAEVHVPVPALLQPVLVPLLVRARHDEELHLHLLELAGAEDEVAGRDLVAEALAGLPDAERRLLARGVHDVQVVDEDALRGLGTQVVHGGGILDGTDRGPQHAVEVARLGEVALGAAVRAGDVGEAVGRRPPVLLLVGLDQLVGAPALVAVLALGQGVGERRDVAGRLPHLGREDDGRVQADDVIATADDRLPPLPAHVLLELHAQRAVVPCRAGAPVDLRRREHEPAALAQIDDGINAISGHNPPILGRGAAAYSPGRSASRRRAVASSIVSKSAKCRDRLRCTIGRDSATIWS